MTEGARTAVPYTKAKAKGRAEGGYRMRQQLEALRGRAGAEVYEVLLRQLSVEQPLFGREEDG